MAEPAAVDETTTPVSEVEAGVAMGVLRGTCTDADCTCSAFQGAGDDGGPCLRCGHTPGTHDDRGAAPVTAEAAAEEGSQVDEDGRVFYDDNDPLGLLDKNGADTAEDNEARKELQDLCEWSISGNELKFLEKLGSGRSAKVYKGLYKDETVAVKVLKPLLDSKELQNFKGELDIMRSIHSEHVVKFYGGCFEPKICLVMEYCSNGSLYHLLQRENLDIDWDMCFRLLIETVTGIAALHAEEPPIVHRDLKSLNLLVNAENKVKVCDFGLSRYTQGSSGNESTLGKLRGTYAYSAPEVYFGEKYSTKSDVFSIGVIMWEVVARVITKKYLRPYKEYKHLRIDFQIIIASAKKGTRPTIPDLCPKSLRALIEQSWDAKPEPRPSAGGLLASLQEVHDDYLANKENWDQLLKEGAVPLDAPEEPEVVEEKVEEKPTPTPTPAPAPEPVPAASASAPVVTAPAEESVVSSGGWAHKGIDTFLAKQEQQSTPSVVEESKGKKRTLTRTASKKLFKIMKQTPEERSDAPKKLSIGQPQWHHKGADQLIGDDGNLRDPPSDDPKPEISSAQWKHFGGDAGNSWMEEDAFEDDKQKKKKRGIFGKFKRKK